MAAPMDLNLPLCEKPALLQKLKMAHQLGYEVVAINNYVSELLVPKKKKKSGEKMKSPKEVMPSEEEIRSVTGRSKKPFKVLSRISTAHTDVSQAHFISTEEVQCYDIVAVQPACEKTFSQACKDLNVDIITIDVTEKFAMRIKRPTLSPAIERGIQFELQYSPGIRDATYRQYFISNAQKLIFWCEGKNVILTSGCEKAIEMRGPYDVANLGLLLNLNENQSKDAVMKNCRTVVCHSEGRKVYSKGTVKVEKASDLPKEESWILEKCDVTVKREDITASDTNGNLNNLHAKDSSDDDNDLESSDINEPVMKKIKLVGT
ncbi:ribonuclease P protein subunit p30-like [Ruditapes philippinarum]|uniref:ribonuclease P protein subunit p30-like n=1 Tax=Ruditapes philippinarum TaxID=129788 RepID=UPI00295A9D4F|nr:ribonuclease P protein subunit p30-like [Ruditapes philippinarum]